MAAIGGSFLPPVVAHLIADIGQFTAAMGTARAEMGTLAAANAKLAAVGKVAMIGLGVAVAAVGYESVKLAMNFDQTLELIHTQAGAGRQEVEMMKKAILDLAPAVGLGPEKLAEGLYHIETTGFRGKEALDILTASARLAAMGLADLDVVTFAMSGTMAVGMKDIRDAADATNYLNAIVGMGDMRMEKLASAIGTGVLPAFKSAGLGMMDFGAAIATITDNSVGADEAATRLRMTISMMAAPSGPAIKALKSIGLSQYDLANDMRQPNGLLIAVKDLKKHLEESGLSAVEQNAVIARAFGGGRTSSAIQTLLGETERLETKYHQLGDAESRAAKAQQAWADQQKQFKQQLHELTAQLQVWGIKLGNWIIPKLQESAKWMSTHTETVKIAAIAIGTILVVAIGAYTVAMVQAAIATIAATWEIMLIVLAIAAIGVGIYLLVKHWDVAWGFIKRTAMSVWNFLLLNWHTIWDNGIKKGAIAVWGWLVTAWNATVHGLSAAVGWIKSNVIDPIVNFWDSAFVKPSIAVWNFLLSVWHGVLALFGWEAKFAEGFLSTVWNTMRQRIMAVLLPAWHVMQTVWGIVWGAITATASWAWNTVLLPTLLFLQATWDMIWGAVVATALWAWNAVLLPTWHAIVEYGINPIIAAAHWLGDAWDSTWAWIAMVVSNTWLGLKVVWGWIKKDGIDPLKSAGASLRDDWDSFWHAIGNGISWVWNNLISPVFNRIKGGINDIKNGFNDIKNAPGAAGAKLAHLAGFADGGWVGGAPGAPKLAVVHGGEYVLSRDMIAAGAGAKPVSGMPAMASGGGSGSGGRPIVLENKLYIDGRELHVAMIPHAQRYKERTGATGLS